jgi:hypothetical protein
MDMKGKMYIFSQQNTSNIRQNTFFLKFETLTLGKKGANYGTSRQKSGDSGGIYV